MTNKSKITPLAVIFDMDGVIVDSMPYHFISWYEAFRRMEIRVSCFDIYEREGENWKKTLLELARRSGVKLSRKNIQKIFGDRRRIFNRYFKQFIFKDVREFLKCLKGRGLKLAIVTGTPKREMKHILPDDIREYFDCLVTGDSVRKGKPDPEPYLKASSTLGIEPGKCVVVENAPLGVRSAKRAGMFCIAITTSLPREYLKEADIVVDDFGEIRGFIDNACKQ